MSRFVTFSLAFVTFVFASFSTATDGTNLDQSESMSVRERVRLCRRCKNL